MDIYCNNDAGYIELGNRLNGVFAYNNISALSFFQEEKYINLWIALESTMTTGQYTNIISHIKEVLPSIMAKKYIYRIIRNFSEDCIRCDIDFHILPSPIDLKKDNKQDLVSELICALNNTDTFTIIESLCASNILLEFRLGEIKDFILDIQKTIQKIARYHETITWHVQRLYRIRNEITHSAWRQEESIVVYIEHLFDYLAILISEIVYTATEKDMTNIEDILPYLKDNYDAMIALSKENNPIIQGILTTGIIEVI